MLLCSLFLFPTETSTGSAIMWMYNIICSPLYQPWDISHTNSALYIYSIEYEIFKCFQVSPYIHLRGTKFWRSCFDCCWLPTYLQCSTSKFWLWCILVNQASISLHNLYPSFFSKFMFLQSLRHSEPTKTKKSSPESIEDQNIIKYLHRTWWSHPPRENVVMKMK